MKEFSFYDGDVPLNEKGRKEHKELNHVKNVLWSPDGSCLLVSDNCNKENLKILNFPNTDPWKPVLSFSTPEPVYATCWHPKMSSLDPSSCLFVASVRDSSIRLYNPYSRTVEATYISQNHVEKISGPNSITFSPNGELYVFSLIFRIYCGFDSRIEIFSVNRPGYDKVIIPTSPSRRSRKGQTGIISSIEFNPDLSGLFACGSFSGSIGLYDQRLNEQICVVEDMGGVTQTSFSTDGRVLYVASRRSNEIKCWDIRNTGSVLPYSFIRPGETNQRISFSLDRESGRFMVSGDTRGHVNVFDLRNVEGEEEIMPVISEKCHEDTVGGVDFHPTMSRLIATGSGQRRYNNTLHGTLLSQDKGYDCSVKTWIL
jgi:WD40 repeat protein